MFFSRIFKKIPFLLSALFLMMNFDRYVPGIGAASVNLENAQRQHRPLSRVSARLPFHYGKIRQGLSELIDDDDLFDLSKRQVADDYGHLRFGKRGEDFDDYGHLRFGRSHGE